jgi:hypothetical protein
MIVPLLLAAGLAASGCHSHGAIVQCVLAPPVVPAAPPASHKTPAHDARARATSTHAHRETRRTASSAASKPHRATATARASTTPAPPDSDAVQRHIQSLVSIGDCTGARTYAAATGETALAEQAFGACIGVPRPPKSPVVASAEPKPVPPAAPREATPLAPPPAAAPATAPAAASAAPSGRPDPRSPPA